MTDCHNSVILDDLAFLLPRVQLVVSIKSVPFFVWCNGIDVVYSPCGLIYIP